MITPSSIHPDTELRDFLQEKISVVVQGGTTEYVAVYGDWEKPTNKVPDDFIIIMHNGDVGGVGMDTYFADGNLMVSMYNRLNDDGSVKKNRVEKILTQFDELIERLITDNYFYKYDHLRFITPTTPNVTSGYSITNLNLRWHTKNKESND